MVVLEYLRDNLGVVDVGAIQELHHGVVVDEVIELLGATGPPTPPGGGVAAVVIVVAVVVMEGRTGVILSRVEVAYASGRSRCGPMVLHEAADGG